MQDTEDFPEAPPPIHKQPWFIGAAIGCGLLVVLVSVAFGVLVYEFAKSMDSAFEFESDWEAQELTELDREVLISAEDLRVLFTDLPDWGDETYTRWSWPGFNEAVWLQYEYFEGEDTEIFIDSEACLANGDAHADEVWHDETNDLRETWVWIDDEEDDDDAYHLKAIEIPNLPGQSHYAIVHQYGEDVGFSFIYREQLRIMTLDVYGKTFVDLNQAREFFMLHIAALRDHEF